MYISRYLFVVLFGFGIQALIHADDMTGGPVAANIRYADMQTEQFLLAQNAPDEDIKPGDDSVPPGTLLLPRDDISDKTDKRCMTVCEQWGEECTYINRGPAGTTRSCRRTCKQYTEECF